MGQFYIQPVGELNVIYELNATTDISVTHGSTVTNYPVESGYSAYDNIVLEPTKASFSGVLTDVKQSGFVPVDNSVNNYRRHPEDYIRGLRKRIDNRELFNIYTTDSIEPLLNVVIISFKISKDTSVGGNSWNVDLSFQQVRTARRARVDVVVDEDFSALVAGKTGSGANSADASASQQQNTFINFGIWSSDERVQRALE